MLPTLSSEVDSDQLQDPLKQPPLDANERDKRPLQILQDASYW